MHSINNLFDVPTLKTFKIKLSKIKIIIEQWDVLKSYSILPLSALKLLICFS